MARYTLADFPRDHIIDTLTRISRGESCGDINRNPTFSYRGSAHLAFTLRDEGYMTEEIVGHERVTPFVMQGGFEVDSWPVWRGELTGKGRALLTELEGNDPR